MCVHVVLYKQHRVEYKNYQDTLDNKIQVFLLEFTKLIENQNLVLTAQKSILLKLRHIEQGDNISNSGLNTEECLPCPENQQLIQQLQLELNNIKINRDVYLIVYICLIAKSRCQNLQAL